MKRDIANLVNRYDQGLLTRRELIQALGMLAGASVAGTASFSAPFQVNRIDHVSLQVKDLDRTVDFYKKVFGLPILNEDKRIKTIRLKAGNGKFVVRNVEPYAVVDHIALGVAPFDKVAAIETLKQQGVTAIDGPQPLTFHVIDPDGYPIQLIKTDNG